MNESGKRLLRSVFVIFTMLITVIVIVVLGRLRGYNFGAIIFICVAALSIAVLFFQFLKHSKNKTIQNVDKALYKQVAAVVDGLGLFKSVAVELKEDMVALINEARSRNNTERLGTDADALVARVYDQTWYRRRYCYSVLSGLFLVTILYAVNVVGHLLPDYIMGDAFEASLTTAMIPIMYVPMLFVVFPLFDIFMHKRCVFGVAVLCLLTAAWITGWVIFFLTADNLPVVLRNTIHIDRPWLLLFFLGVLAMAAQRGRIMVKKRWAESFFEQQLPLEYENETIGA